MKFFMGPKPWPETVQELEALGHEHVELADAEVYLNATQNPRLIPPLPAGVKWVQHCFAGVNGLIDAGVISEDGLPWCNAKGAFGKPVAETALGLLLAAAHNHKKFALAGTWDIAREVDSTQKWLYPRAARSRVAIFGAGGIGRELIRLLEPFDCHITAVTRTGHAVEGADVNVAIGEADHVWGEADFIVSILPMTVQTAGLIDAACFRAMKPSALFINVGRGATVNTDDLVWALETGEIAGAAMDVVDPEPLPDGHPLFALPNATITPHIAASSQVAKHHIAQVVDANARAFAAGEPLSTRVDVQAGY